MDSFNGDVFVAGTLRANAFVPPAACVPDGAIETPAAGAAGIQTSKLNHRERSDYSQAEGTAAVTETRIGYIAYGTVGATQAVRAAIKTACIGAATITVDYKKNGTSILTAPITFNSSSPTMTAVAATISTAATAAGDVFEWVITATAGGGTLGQGIYAEAVHDENPS